MATENPTLSALDEQVSPAVAEDVQAAPEATVEVAEPETAETTVEVDFSDEEAALAAQEAGLELDDETAEEAATATATVEEEFASMTKSEMLDRFAAMLDEKPIQALRRTVDQLKVAFYRIRRAEVDAARRQYLEEGGAEEQFVAPTDEAEVRLKELFKEYRTRRDAFIAKNTPSIFTNGKQSSLKTGIAATARAVAISKLSLKSALLAYSSARPAIAVTLSRPSLCAVFTT